MNKLTKHLKVEDVKLIKDDVDPYFIQEEGNELFYVFDKTYEVPKAHINILLRYNTPDIFTRYIRNIEETFIKEHDTLLTNYQVSFDISITVQGILIKIGGFSTELKNIAKVFMEYFFKCEDDSRRCVVDELVKDDLLSQLYTSPYKRTFQGLNKLLKKGYRLPEEILKELEENSKDCKKDICKFKVSIDAVGNMTFDDAKEIFDSIVSFSESEDKEQVSTKQVNLKKYEIDTKDTKNNAVAIFFKICNSSDIEGRAKARIICQLLEERFFDQLRTNEELGYIVSTNLISTINDKIETDKIETYIYFVVQSEKTPDFLIDRIMRFTREATDFIASIDNHTYDTYRISVLESLMERPKNIYDYSEFIHRHFVQGIKTFEFRDLMIKSIKQITHDDIKKLDVFSQAPIVIVAKRKSELDL